MLRAKKSLESFHKNNKILIFVFGGIYTAYGLFQIGIVKLQKKFLTSEDFEISDNGMLDTIDVVYNNILLTMPYLIALGIGYLIFGFFYKSAKPQRLMICYAILAASVLWSFFYVSSSVDQLTLIYDNLEGELGEINDIPVVSKFASASKIMGIIGLLTSVAYVLGPIIILTLRIKLNDVE